MTDERSDDDRTYTHEILAQGTDVGHYRIERKIGAGGMGEVYRAVDTRLNRQVALKFLPVHLVASEEIRTRFVREARTLGRLNHPNVVSVYDVSDFHGRPFYVMELVEGESLHHYAHEKPLPIDLIIEYAIQICQGLGEAHRAGIVHRDIKAANMAVDTSGRVRLLDFGLAAHEEDEKITRSGSTLGTVAYMSPEQVSGRDIDRRSDLFSLGIVLYELIAGRTPFKRDSEGATLKAIIEDTPEPLTRYKSDVPEKLQAIVMELLDKDKELRYQTAEGVIADLKRLMYDSQPTGHSSAPPPPSRNRGLMIGVAAAVLAAIATVTWLLLPRETLVELDQDEVPMIAVLPFENLGSADDKYFADGMTEEITSRLAVISGLGVISRSSAMKYEELGKTIREFGEQLGVDYVLEGTVRWSKVGDKSRIRITPELIRVADDRHIWGDNYERDLLEVFAVQAEIASRIVDQLGLTLIDTGLASMAERPTDNAEAYRHYLKGLAGFVGLTDAASPLRLQSSAASLDTAVALDPEFALAHAVRSKVYSILAFLQGIKSGAAQAHESAMRARELAPNSPQTRDALGTYYNVVEMDYDRALEQFRLARSEMHSNPDVFAGLAFVHLRQGRFEEAQQEFLRAAELDPLSPLRYWSLAQSYRSDNEYDQALKAISTAINLAPKQAGNYRTKVQLLRDRYGDWSRIDPTIHEALRNCDTVDIAAEDWAMITRVPAINMENLISRFMQRYSGEMEPSVFYLSLANAFEFLGDTASSIAYADSASQWLEIRLRETPDHPHLTSNLGLALAKVGDCDRAEEIGQRGKELLSVSDCHW